MNVPSVMLLKLTVMLTVSGLSLVSMYVVYVRFGGCTRWSEVLRHPMFGCVARKYMSSSNEVM